MSVSQTVIITGASSGIGAEIARRFSRENYNLLLLGRDEGNLRKVQQECKPSRSEVLAFDLSQLAHHKKEIQEKLSRLSPPSILVNNAGIFAQGSLLETSDNVWLEQFQTNLFSAVQLTKIVWPFFLESKSGSILNISSSLGVRPTAFTGAYSASKAAMINWTQSLAQEGGPLGIRVNCICPGIVDTPIHAFHSLPAAEKAETLANMASLQLLNFVGQTADIAEAAYFLASDHSRWTTGSNLIVDGGIGLK